MTSAWRDRGEDPVCIEVKFLTRRVKGFCVRGYEDDLDRARHLSSPKALTFFELTWTMKAPPVEKLTREWRKHGSQEFRISDWETYCAQMDELLGIT